MRPDLQLALLRLDDQDRRELRRRCGGDWDRVTVGEDGSFRVHQRPQPRIHPHGPAAPGCPAIGQRLHRLRSMVAAWLELLQRESLALGLRVLATLVHLCRAAGRWAEKEFAVMWRDVLTLLDREPPAGAEPSDWWAVDLHRVASAIPGLWRDALVASKGFVYREETWARYGGDVNVVAATLARPERVEMHPLSFSPLANQAVVSFHRDGITVVLRFLDPAYPEVVAVLVGPLLEGADQPAHGTGDCVCRTCQSVPSTYCELSERLAALGAVVRPDEYGLFAKVTYKGQEGGPVNAGDGVPVAAVHTDWWRTVWWMQAIDQRGREY